MPSSTGTDPLTIVKVALLLFASIGALALMADTGQTVDQSCVSDEAEREHVRKMMLAASEQGFQNHLLQLFSVWIREKERMGRTEAGAHLGIAAYHQAREFALKWNPPFCATGQR